MSREEIERMFGQDELKQTRFYQDVKAEGITEGIAQGRVEGEISLILRQLKRKINISAKVEQKIRSLNIEQLENLGEALLDFNQESDVLNWLDK
jgi:predicted transposase YdaD